MSRETLVVSAFMRVIVVFNRWLPFGTGFSLGIGLAYLDEMGGIEEFVEVKPGADKIGFIEDLENGFIGKGIVAYVVDDLFPLAGCMIIGKLFKCHVRIKEFFFGKMPGEIIPRRAVLTPTAICLILVEHPQVDVCFCFYFFFKIVFLYDLYCRFGEYAELFSKKEDIGGANISTHYQNKRF